MCAEYSTVFLRSFIAKFTVSHRTNIELRVNRCALAIWQCSVEGHHCSSEHPFQVGFSCFFLYIISHLETIYVVICFCLFFVQGIWVCYFNCGFVLLHWITVNMFSLDTENKVCCVWYRIQYKKRVLNMFRFLRGF